jgi:multidrug efflux pump
MLAADADVKQFATYVGNGSPRFYLPLDQQLFNDNFAQFVITPPDIEARERLRARLQTEFARDDGAWSDVRPRVLRLENGPPVGYAVQFRVSGENLTELRRMAEEVAVVMRANPHTKDVHFDWNDQVKQIRLELDHDRARAMGVSALDISSYLNTLLNGQVSTQVREADQLIDVVLRSTHADRNLASQLSSINIHVGNGKYVPLAQLVKIHYENMTLGEDMGDRIVVERIKE